MNRVRLIPLLIISFAIAESGECHRRRRVLWRQRTNIGDAVNWEGERIPCASDALLFPQQSYDLVKLSDFTMRELILPKSGGFILDTQTSLRFRENADPKCQSGASTKTSTYKSVIRAPWLSTDSWEATRSSDDGRVSINAATPHDERVPCDNDDIVFPINSSFVVDLQQMPLLTFSSIAVDGRVMSASEFRDFLITSSVGQSSFKNFDGTLFDSDAPECSSNSCVCHARGNSLREQLCENEKPFCQPTPHCSDPVIPIGHCCPLCGAVFQMPLSSSVGQEHFDMDAFAHTIDEAIAGDRDGVVYHSSVTLGEGAKPFLQLVIVDRGQYDERSSGLMKRLRDSVLNKLDQSQSKFYFIAGTAFTPNASGHVLTFVLGPLLLVVLFMTLIYVVYYDDNHIPRLMAAIRNRRFMHHSDVIFARFDNTSHANERATNDDVDVDDTDSVVEVDLHFGTDQSIENVNRAFNNPMFNAQEAEAAVKARDDIDATAATAIDGDDDGSGIKEEKL